MSISLKKTTSKPQSPRVHRQFQIVPNYKRFPWAGFPPFSHPVRDCADNKSLRAQYDIQSKIRFFVLSVMK